MKNLLIVFSLLVPLLIVTQANAKTDDLDLTKIDLNALFQTKKVKSPIIKKDRTRSKTKLKSKSKKSKFKQPKNCLRLSKMELLRISRPYGRTINKYARLYNVDGNLVRAVIAIESCYKPKALSHAGAQGLMQLMPGTAKRFWVSNSYNPKQNIRGGTKYLKFLIKRYKGDLEKVLAAYNSGEGNVDKYKGIPPFKETQNYVKNVLRSYLSLNYFIRKGYYLSRSKPGRSGYKMNRRLAPHLYKKR